MSKTPERLAYEAWYRKQFDSTMYCESTWRGWEAGRAALTQAADAGAARCDQLLPWKFGNVPQGIATSYRSGRGQGGWLIGEALHCSLGRHRSANAALPGLPSREIAEPSQLKRGAACSHQAEE